MKKRNTKIKKSAQKLKGHSPVFITFCILLSRSVLVQGWRADLVRNVRTLSRCGLFSKQDSTASKAEEVKFLSNTRTDVTWLAMQLQLFSRMWNLGMPVACSFFVQRKFDFQMANEMQISTVANVWILSSLCGKWRTMPLTFTCRLLRLRQALCFWCQIYGDKEYWKFSNSVGFSFDYLWFLGFQWVFNIWY